MRKITIQSEHSAVAANTRKASRSVQAAINALRKRGAERVCEIGCGLLANTPHFLRAFPSVVLTDQGGQYERIKYNLAGLARQYRSLTNFVDANAFRTMALGLDAAIVINVLHVLPSIEERVECLEATSGNLHARGFVYVDVPHNVTYYQKPPKNSVRFRDGWAIRKGDYFTFYKDMSTSELAKYAARAGFLLDEKLAIDHRSSVVFRKP